MNFQKVMIKHNIFDEEVRAAVEEAKGRFLRNPYFSFQCEWCGELLFKRRDAAAAARVMGLGIEYAALCGLDGALLPLIYIDRLLPAAWKCLKEDGLTEEEAAGALQDIGIWTRVYKKYHHGKIGLERLDWVLRSVAGTVKRFGSLQFEEVTYEYPFLILRCAKQGEYRAFARAGLAVDQDGYLCGTNGRTCVRKTITSLSLEQGRIEGFEADLEKGIIMVGGSSSLDLDGWEIILVPGQKTLAIHVPEGTDISEEKMNLSLERALAYYRGGADGLFVCDSWLLDPHLSRIAPEGGRICRFMERFYKLPVYAQVPQILERVMGFDYVPGAAGRISCKTSLQKSLQTYLLEENEVFTTAGFMIYEPK